MLASVTHILPLTTIRRERVLPVPGRVVVRRGQKVSTTNVIAEARLAPEHLMLNVALGLGLPAERADSHVQCKAGTMVSEGDVLAGPVGITQRVVRSPCSGRVIVVGDGQVLLEVESPPYELRAGLPGKVTDLIGDRGAIIEAEGALIQGVWGNGRIGDGLMFDLASTPDDVLTSDRLDVSHRGSIILGGHCEDAEVLQAASELPLRGLILASIEPKLVPAAVKASFPIVVIEGFGHLPMNSAAYKLLSTNERRDVAINAEPWDRFKGSRPEVVIPLPTSGKTPYPRETDIFSLNQQVHIVRAPHAGKIGTLIALCPGLTVLPNGLRVRAAEVRLENRDEVVVPLANLVVLN